MPAGGHTAGQNSWHLTLNRSTVADVENKRLSSILAHDIRDIARGVYLAVLMLL